MRCIFHPGAFSGPEGTFSRRVSYIPKRLRFSFNIFCLKNRTRKKFIQKYCIPNVCKIQLLSKYLIIKIFFVYSSCVGSREFEKLNASNEEADGPDGVDPLKM